MNRNVASPPADGGGASWRLAARMLTRPYRLTAPMVGLMVVIPFYIVISELTRGRTLYSPEFALDRAVPLWPAWSLVYGSYYMFGVLPVLVMRQQEQIRRTFLAYLMVWLVAYAAFVLCPTVAPRPPKVLGGGFFTWALRIIYQADPPYNCFPSLHVAHASVTALTCCKIHRGLGIGAGIWASLIAVSTLFTKQHYAADVLAGALLAGAAWVLFLRDYPGDAVPALDRRAAPLLALGCLGAHGLIVAGFWMVYQIRGSG